MIPIYKPFWPKNSKNYALKALEDCWLIMHDNNTIVEEQLAERTGAKHVILTCNGTAAIHLVAKCLQYKHPEVTQLIVPNLVYVAAWNAFLQENFGLHMARTNLNTWNFDVEHVAKLVDFKNSAILAVHNLGNPLPVQELLKFGIPVVEDACEALFGSYGGQKVPSLGLASALSFFGNKTVTSGEGGAFVTNDDELADYAKRLRGQGQTSQRYIHDVLGYNYRMTNIQAAILRGQLEYADEILDRKADIWNYYDEAFSNREDVLIQMTEKDSSHSKWMYGIRLPNRNESFEVKQAFFNSRGFDIRPMFYPMRYHAHLKENRNVWICNDEVGDLISQSSIMLPSFPDITREEQSIVISSVNEFLCHY
ncbi:DegT/DnrJ/EryC1/StrS aminotransferase family protein [Candidatus Pacearchaeota archaeon]|jgi:perosamine synthetase|nr:DegT/DnrJ/EryC1/StrS aminotransferase family protein [Candidatus Pacearchaeota archaeon]